MATGTLSNDRNLTIQLPHQQESFPHQPSQILNEMNNYPETPPPSYDQALKYTPGIHQPLPPIPVMNNNVQSTAVNSPVPYTNTLEHNNAQTTSINCALVQEPPKPSNRIVMESAQLTIPYTCEYYNAQTTAINYAHIQEPSTPINYLNFFIVFIFLIINVSIIIYYVSVK